MPEEEKLVKETKASGAGRKFLWSALDRFVFIAVGALGTIATTYITGTLKLNPPKLIVTQTYNRVDAAPVANSVGGLKLDYKADAARTYGVLRVDIANDGRGSAEKVRFQVKLPQNLKVSYQMEPDFRVYQPTLLELKNNEFYVEMPKFPSKAADLVALRIEGDEALLCDARTKFVSEDYEGEVNDIQGVKCE